MVNMKYSSYIVMRKVQLLDQYCIMLYKCSEALSYFEKVMKLPTAMSQTGAWIFQQL